MSTKISALTERVQSDIIGDEFFPIIDGGSGGSVGDVTAYQTFKIKLDTLFQSGQGFEKLTSLTVTDGETVSSNNTSFTLRYTDEAGADNDITIAKYEIQNGDVDFEHINTTDLVTSTERISSGANTIANDKLATVAAIDEHIIHKENLLFNNSDSAIKTYFGDSTTDRTTGNHILKEFRLNSEVAQDLLNLQNGASTITTFKAVEDKFDVVGVGLEEKISTDQVNDIHFRIDPNDLSNRLNIRELAIRRELIADNAVNSEKITNKGVLNANIADDAITTRTILNSAVTSEKINDGAISPAKLSSNAPSWNSTTVNIPKNLSVNDDITVSGNITQKGTTLGLGGASSTLGSGGRALVLTVGNKLTINELNDFDGGVRVRGIVTVPDMSDANISAGGERSVVTKEYVDAADILLNPIGSNKILDNAITLEKMADDSVVTA